MRWVFAATLILGMLTMIGWAMVQGNRSSASDLRRRVNTSRVIAATVAFGMGGLSAAYAGWNLWLATLAALGAAALAAWYAGTVAGAAGEVRD